MLFIENGGVAHEDLEDVIGPLDPRYQPYVVKKSQFALEKHRDKGDDDKVSRLIESPPQSDANCTVVWRDMMQTQKRLAESISPPKPKFIGKGRPQSAIQLTTPKQHMREIISGPQEEIEDVCRELRGLGVLALDDASIEVRTTDSRKRMHRDVHNAATDLNTDGVHISAAKQYLDYLMGNDSSKQNSTFSKIRAIPRSSSGQLTHRQRTLSASDSAPLLGTSPQ